ncbi:MAG TPA: SGNH/GDSL hydrolase family protein, partial [Candidatus Dormibacteraeota bacterium]
MSRGATAALLASVTALLLCACSPGPTVHTTAVALPGTGDGPTLVDVAVGASETVGAGTQDRLRSAWPQVLYLTALQRGAVFYNFGIPGASVAQALTAELPQALAVHPDLVTVWLNVNDLLAGVPPAQYESRL